MCYKRVKTDMKDFAFEAVTQNRDAQVLIAGDGLVAQTFIQPFEHHRHDERRSITLIPHNPFD